MAEVLEFDDARKVLVLIAEQLAKAPLYNNLVYKDLSNARRLPETVSLFCESCDKETNWETYISPTTDYRAGFGEKEYLCRNCKEGRVTYHFYWGSSKAGEGKILFFKIGQWPALEERIPKELKKSLDRGGLSLYHKALVCRNQNLGMGSLTYLRRVVEDKLNFILDMIAVEASGVGFAQEDVSKVEEVKARGLFKEKIDLAVTILPPSLRPGGHNPIDALHDLVSDGIHRRSEEECVEVFDRVRFVFEYLFREIDARRRNAAEYAGAVAKLASNRR